MGAIHFAGDFTFYIGSFVLHRFLVGWKVGIALYRSVLKRYRTLADRLLGLRLVPSQKIINRNVSYEFMNRQMVWHAFTVSL
jgi:hypothetical protein